MRNIVRKDGSISNGEYTEKVYREPVTNAESFYKRSLHIFDSNGGVANGHGFTFRSSHSLDKIIGFRIASILVDGISGPPFSNPIYLAVHSNLSRASYSGHRNGQPENIISIINNPGTAARIVWTYPINGNVPIEMDTVSEVYLELRDNTGLPQPQFRFVITIEFTHSY